MSDYKVVNITPDTYAKVSKLAEKNGFSLGQQVKVWADRDMPQCGHELIPVPVQFYPDIKKPDQDKVYFRPGWYCPKCRRVYAEAG